VTTCECRVLVPWTGARGIVGSAGVEARDVLELEAAFTGGNRGAFLAPGGGDGGALCGFRGCKGGEVAF